MHFYFKEDEETIVPAGNMVLYRPREMQRYVYFAKDQTEVYWVHFTGRNVKQILKRHHFPVTEHIINTGISPEYQKIYREMIQELQLCRPHYEELLAVLLLQLFVLVDRHSSDNKIMNSFAQNEVELAVSYFNEHYNLNISIEEYAASRNMSTSWFIRNFKLYNGTTPLNYILSIRIANAQFNA